MQQLPAGAPSTIGEAYAQIAAMDDPSVEDLKLMVLIEAAGKGAYEDLAEQVDNEAVRALLRHNGREELAHAYRMSKAIGKLTGTDYPVPAPEENPYLAAPATAPAVTPEMLAKLADAEFGGEQLYERWAANCPNEEAAALMRLNGREEKEHGARMHEAAALLAQ